jgi:hypothetical protein
MADTDVTRKDESAKLTPIQAAGILLGLVVVLAIYLYMAQILGLAALFTGNLVLFYWASFGELKLEALPATVIGALAGILNASLFSLLPPLIGPVAGIAVGAVLVLIAIYFILMRWLRLVFNDAYMLLVNVVLIPSVLAKGGFFQMSAAVLFSGAFWGGLVLVGAWIKARRSPLARA